MTLEQLRQSIRTDTQPPEGISGLLVAMWWDAHGDWAEAHRVAQNIETRDGSRVHAYLHRVEGDSDNARYWYRRAGHTECADPLEVEWESLVLEFLEKDV